MTHHAGPPAEERGKPQMSTGRLALWLGFWLFIAIMVMGTVVSLTGNGGQ